MTEQITKADLLELEISIKEDIDGTIKDIYKYINRMFAGIVGVALIVIGGLFYYDIYIQSSIGNKLDTIIEKLDGFKKDTNNKISDNKARVSRIEGILENAELSYE